MHGRSDYKAFAVGIKEKAALQWVEMALSTACDRQQLPWCLFRRQMPTFFPPKLCPRTAGPLCKAGCQLIDVSVASSITQVSSSLPLGAEVTAFHPETADKCRRFLPPPSLCLWFPTKP